ncbi:MAG: hypothetical protein B7Z08_08345 [Sphingomonadales bacterium 32-68-7]|nr:MAG: hypothetical protein B7Z33_10135 [Sphingomonadales bacterium 12-68-11]OYX08729.1 MAG: hypothetical protein B7Z08_08345 [Sphingomonadales bacterium 32-68-7]
MWWAALAAVPVGAEPGGERWIESWGTALPLQPPPPPPAFRPPDAPARPAAPQAALARPPQPASPFVPFPATLHDQTVRMVLRTSVGGDRFRLEFANANGAQVVELGAVHAGLAGENGSVAAGSDRAVTFGGKPTLTLQPGARVFSDPIDLRLAPLSRVAVSIYLPVATPATTVDALGLMPAFIAAGDQTGAPRLSGPQAVSSFFWLRGLSVPAADAAAGTIVTLGDSITEGYATTAGANRAWPDLLAQRLQADPDLAHWGVVNVGISGNRVLRPGVGDAALARFSEDVLTRPGVKWVLILEGINDINMAIMPGMPDSEDVTASALIAAFDQLIDRAHLHGIRVAGGTLLPTKGLPFYSAEGEALRQELNTWIRTSGRFDRVIDFEAATRDPADPLRLRPDFDPGDHVHPNDAGNQAMADAFDLAWLKSK